MADLAGQIAQVIIPSDSTGNPSMVLVDWPNTNLWLLGSGGQRIYTVALATQNPVLSVVGSPNVGNAPLAAGCDAAGNCLWQGGSTNSQTVYRLDPTTLESTASHGSNNSSLGNYPVDIEGSESICCITTGGVAYALCKSSISANCNILRTDDMTAAGASIVVSGAFRGHSWMVPGYTGTSIATAYFIDKTLSGAQASVGVYTIAITSGAKDYNIATWPTPNPDINGSQIGSLSAAGIDASLSTITTNGIGFDSHAGIIVADVNGNTGVRYLVGLSRTTAAIIWRLALPDVNWPIDLTQCRIASSNLPYLNSSITIAPILGIQTASGADTANTVTGVGAGDLGFNTYTDDQSQLMVCDAFFSGSGQVTPVSGSASSFAGLAILSVWPPFPPAPPPTPVIGPGTISGPLGGWRGIVGINWQGLALLGDAWAGIVGLSDFDAFTEYGNPMVMLVTSPPIQNDRKRIFIRKFELDIQAATADLDTPDPQLNLDYSRDGGMTWKPLLIRRSMGQIGQYTKRLRWLNLGESRAWVLRITISDPVRRTIIGAYVDLAAGIG
jgi:hypothetical protein